MNSVLTEHWELSKLELFCNIARRIGPRLITQTSLFLFTACENRWLKPQALLTVCNYASYMPYFTMLSKSLTLLSNVILMWNKDVITELVCRMTCSDLIASINAKVRSRMKRRKMHKRKNPIWVACFVWLQDLLVCVGLSQADGLLTKNNPMLSAWLVMKVC